MKLNKQAVKKVVDGYKKANVLMGKERKKRLSRLKDKESFLEYDNLCKMGEINLEREGTERLEQEKIVFLLRRRQILSKIAKRRT